MQSEINNLRFSNLQAHNSIISQINTLSNKIDNIDPDDTTPQDYDTIREELDQLDNSITLLNQDYEDYKAIKQQQLSLMQSEINNLRFSYSRIDTIIIDIDSLKEQANNLRDTLDTLQSDFSTKVVRYDVIQELTGQQKRNVRETIGAIDKNYIKILNHGLIISN